MCRFEKMDDVATIRRENEKAVKEYFTYVNQRYRVLEAETCFKCAFYHHMQENMCSAPDELGNCSHLERKDGKSVIFMKKD